MAEYWVRLTPQSPETGPFSANQIRARAAAGDLPPTALLSNNRTTWHLASSVKGLFGPKPTAPSAKVPASPAVSQPPAANSPPIEVAPPVEPTSSPAPAEPISVAMPKVRSVPPAYETSAEIVASPIATSVPVEVPMAKTPSPIAADPSPVEQTEPSVPPTKIADSAEPTTEHFDSDSKIHESVDAMTPAISQNEIEQSSVGTLSRPGGRSGSAVAAGYVGLFSFLLFPAPIAVGLGLAAIFDLKKHPDRLGMDRAIFALAMGTLGSAGLALVLANLGR